MSAIPHTKEEREQSDRFNARLVAQAHETPRKSLAGELGAWAVLIVIVAFVIVILLIAAFPFWLNWDTIDEVLNQIRLQ